jgi:DNA/RNA-binding domain of Phe-tRNA-synthetase-like protein
MIRIPSISYDGSMAPDAVRVAIVWGFGMPECLKTGVPPPYLSDLLERAKTEGEAFLPPARKSAVRQMLRFGNYKPSGRSKPSSEYLLAAALQDSFPLVNPPVDINNAVSLQSGYPASIFDLDRCGLSLLLRRGAETESYVFNPSGQSIQLRDLLCVCRREGDLWIPCGNPVKDSMATKTGEKTRKVVAVIYAPGADAPDDLEKAAARFASLLLSDGGVRESGWALA